MGHVELLLKRRPITEALSDDTLGPETKEKLRLVQKIRHFASVELKLPDNDSYRSFADIERRYVVWNVFATPALSLIPIESCFFVVGCLSYRGYYDEANAQAFADELRVAGHDVYVGGVAAYSTLGWFDDPVLNTMLYWDDRRLARLIFHELTHQLVYVKNDALFNESLATSFADIGLQRWLLAPENNTLSQNDSVELDKARELDFIQMILGAQRRLDGLYASESSIEIKRKNKAAIFAELLREYEQFKNKWAGYNGYDDWMLKDLNNAKIASVVTYHSYDKSFQHLLQQVDNELPRFIKQVKAIANLGAKERHACLRELNLDKDFRCTF